MSTLLNRAINDLIPASTELMYHIYGTHIIRSSLLLLSGKPLATNGDRMRSKKSKAWKGSVAPMKNLLESVEGKGAHEERKNVPQEFRDTLSALRRALDVGLGKGQSATLVRDAAIQPISCIPVQVGLEDTLFRLSVLNWANRSYFNWKPMQATALQAAQLQIDSQAVFSLGHRNKVPITLMPVCANRLRPTPLRPFFQSQLPTCSIDSGPPISRAK